MNYAVVFMRYNLTGNPKVWEDTHCPTVASIATLRAVNQDIKIYVLDSEPRLEDWFDFPRLLNFHVVQYPNQIPIPYEGGWEMQKRMVSRPWDLWAFSQLIPESIVIYADSDIFWLRDPLPLGNDPTHHLYGDLRGDGFFYFNKHDHGTQVFLNCWRGMVVGAIVSDDLRTKMRLSGYHSPMMLAEMPMMYLVRNGMTRGWGPVDPLEHYFPADPDEAVNPDARNLHAHSGMFGSDRLRIVRKVVEFNQAVRRALPEKFADMLLGTEQPEIPFVQVGQLARS